MCQCNFGFRRYVVVINLPKPNSVFLQTKALNSTEKDLSPLISGLPITGQEFFGRVSEMDQLCRHFHTQDSVRKVVVIWGFGGLGKSRLALRYIDAHQSRYSAIIWVNAATFETAMESFSQAASNIESRDQSISPPTGGKEDIHAVHRWLQRSQTKDNWLLVIDSVDDDKFEFRDLIPQCHCGNVIITSTLSHLAEHLDCHGIELGSIDSAAGADMLLFRSRSSNESKSSKRYLIVPIFDADMRYQGWTLRKKLSKSWAVYLWPSNKLASLFETAYLFTISLNSISLDISN